MLAAASCLDSARKGRPRDHSRRPLPLLFGRLLRCAREGACRRRHSGAGGRHHRIARLGCAGRRQHARRSVGAGARRPPGWPRGAHRQRAGRRGVGRRRRRQASGPVCRPFHAQPGAARCGRPGETRAHRARLSGHLPVSGDAPVSTRLAGGGASLRAGRRARRPVGLRALRRAIGRCSEEAQSAEPVRYPAGRSAGAGAARERPSQPDCRHSPFRRRLHPRGTDGRSTSARTSSSTPPAPTTGSSITRVSR